MKLGFDVDGVLANFCWSYKNLIVALTGRDLIPMDSPEWKPPVWYWDTHYGYTDAESKACWDYIKQSTTFWSSLAPFREAVDLAAEAALDHETYFITDRPGPESQAETAAWLSGYGVDLPSVIISRKGKGVVANALDLDFYIDDKAENIMDVVEKSPKTATYLLDCPYNQHCTVGKRVYSVEEALNELR